MNDWLDAERHADQALEWFERGRWAEAESELRKALALNPNQPEWHHNLGLTLEASGRDAEALVCFERCIDLDGEQIEAMLAAGAASNRLGKHEYAHQWLTKCLKADPRLDLAYAGLIESHFQRGDHEEAETTFYLSQQMIEEPSAPCLSAIAESLFRRRKYDRAGWCLREALRMDPGMPRLRGRLAGVLAVIGKSHQAMQMYLRELQDDPGNIDTLHEYGELLMDLGRGPEAAEKFRRILELHPANVGAHFRLGEIAISGGNEERAHIEFELVYKLDPGFPRVRLALAEALLRRNRPQEAASYLREQLDLLQAEIECDEDEKRPVPWSGEEEAELARLLLGAGLADEAASLYVRVIDLLGESPDLLRQLALARFQSDNRAGGVVVSRRVIRLDPGCLSSMHNLALAALEEDRLLTAAGWIRRGLRIDRHDDGLRRLRMRLWLAFVSSLGRRVLHWGRHDPARS